MRRIVMAEAGKSSAFAQMHMTTMLDRQRSFGIAIATVPPAAMPSEPPSQVADVEGELGIRVRHRIRRPNRQEMEAAMTALFMSDSASAVVRGTERLLRERRDGSAKVGNPRLRAFVTDCMDIDAVPMDANGVSRWRLSDLLLEGGEELCIAAPIGGEGVVMAAVVRLGTVVTVARAGPCASALAYRLGEWVAPKAEQPA